MNKVFLTILLSLVISIGEIIAQTVKIEVDSTSLQARYAAQKLQEKLKHRYKVDQKNAPFLIRLTVDTISIGLESYEIIPFKNGLTIKGGKGAGIIYGAQSVAEEVRNNADIKQIKAKKESPKVAFRAIKFDLPWDTYRHSYALDLHQETCKDLKYWEGFLDMMVENRFNSLTLWNLHPYTLMIKPTNFPEASPFTENELKEWQVLFKGIFAMAKERGIDSYLVPFNIFVSPEFAKAHNVAMDNLEHHFFVRGDTSEIIKRYTKECVAQVLQEYPDLTGMGLTLGEGMAGMTPQQREDWMKETIIEGMRLANRKSKLIHRIPFSSTTGSLGPTSKETEVITRKGIEAEAAMDFIEGPVWADLKFNWSHGHSTTKLIKVHGGKLFGTYFDPVPTSYKINWTVRNEDFFCLRWGVPSFVRAHIKENTPPYVGGYIIGSETYIPAKDYFTNPGIKVDWKWAFERQWLFYKLWGRLLYNPSTADALFEGDFIRRYGKPATVLLKAYSLASSTPLRLASSYDFTWDFTLYSEGFLALDSEKKRLDFISVDRMIKQPPIDPDYVSIPEYVKSTLAGSTFAANRMTPLELAALLEKDCNEALKLVSNINVTGNNTLMYEVADVKTWSYLGLYFLEKLRGGVDLQTYRQTDEKKHKQSAIAHLENALTYWQKVVEITRPIYNDMPLVHFSEQDGKNWKENDHLRFHWEKLLPDVVRDIEMAKME